MIMILLPLRVGLEDVSVLSEFTPSFMWLLRDFFYDLQDKGVRVRTEIGSC